MRRRHFAEILLTEDRESLPHSHELVLHVVDTDCIVVGRGASVTSHSLALET